MSTTTTIILILIALASYLIGAIPWGYLIGKRHGVDIRTLGSRNIGATNVTRVIGKWNGRLCFLLDFLKGFIPVLAVTFLLRGNFIRDEYQISQMLAALCAVLGHMFPVYLWFRGGKGVSTAAGALLALAPYSFAVAGAVWAVVYLISRYVSLASIAAAAVLPVTATFIYFFKNDLYPRSPYVLAFLYLLAVLAILRHTSNIKRLLNGTENRFRKEEE
ncbi:MAG: glycerol-3-phosphate 1-O-acyltransferase PlsY [Victivallales bacterium]|nr:glycerol-3-phosphate 1-O-acyltransferase PlsY [Victivallales bacterium]